MISIPWNIYIAVYMHATDFSAEEDEECDVRLSSVVPVLLCFWTKYRVHFYSTSQMLKISEKEYNLGSRTLDEK